MNRVLIITYYWPPSGGAGVQRWVKFVKYLRLYGWEPVVYTPENPEMPAVDPTFFKDIPEGIEVIKRRVSEPYRIYKFFTGRKKEDKIKAGFLSESKRTGLAEKMALWIRGNLFIPDARRSWIRPSVKFLTHYLKNHPVEAVVSTGPPHSMHLIALKLSEKLLIPWLADFRDPWTSIDFYQDLMLTRSADRKHRRLEKQVLSEANAVVVISKSMASGFSAIVSRNYDIITNGYDEELSGPIPITPGGKFTLAHFGSMVRTRNPVAVWIALEALLNENRISPDDLEVSLTGQVDHSVKESLESHHLTRFVNYAGYLPHDETVRRMKTSQVLLLVINRTPNARMILTGKLFEYIATRRPLLCIGPTHGDAADIITETGSGVVSDYEDVERIKETLIRYYGEFKTGRIHAASGRIEKYTRKNLCAEMAWVLDRITTSRIQDTADKT